MLLLGELRLQGFVGALVRMSFGEPRQRLGPAERGALTIGIARGLAPGRQQVDALLGSSAAAAKRSLAVMVRFLLLGFQHHDEPEAVRVTSTPKKV